MRIEKEKEAFIQVDYFPHDHAKKAYQDGYFLEAIQVIHGCIERQLRELVFLGRATKVPHENFCLAYDLMLEIPLNIAVKVLFIQMNLSQKERDNILNFNKARNNLIHKIYYDNADGNWRGYPKNQYDKAFKDGLKLMFTLEEKVHSYNNVG